MAHISSPFYKRCVGFLAATLLICCCAVTALAEDTFAVVYGTNSLNLRDQPTTSGEWLGAYPRGTWVTVNGSSGNWYSVETADGKAGYMSKNYLTRGATSKSTVAVVSNPKASSFLNLRKTPSYNAKVLRILYNGVPLKVLGSSNGWYRVSLFGEEGYVRSEYVTRRSYVASDTVATIKTPNNSALNMRGGPGTNYSTIRQFAGDRYVMVLAKGTKWWRVSIDGYVGFMSAEYLQEGLKAALDLKPGGLPGGTSGGGTGGQPTGGAYGIVTNPRATQYLNLREKASTSSTSIGQYWNGERVSILRQGTEWCEVYVDDDGITGYMMTRYLKLYNAKNTPTLRVSQPQGSFVNLRSAPSLTNSNVLLRVSSGKNVTVVAPGDDWVKVKYNGYTGYMVASFLK